MSYLPETRDTIRLQRTSRTREFKLESYLNRATTVIQRGERFGVSQSAILEAFDAAESVSRTSDIMGLAQRLEGARKQVLHKVNKYEESRGEFREVQAFEVNITGGQINVDRIDRSPVWAIGPESKDAVSGRSVKVLFLAANPRAETRLALDEEIRSITEKIRLAEGRDLVQVVQAWAVRPDDLLQQLNQHKPHVVHFSGHGSAAGELILVNNQGHNQPVSAAALRALFTTLKDNIQVVLLNACYSRVQGEAIAQVINFVVGMGDEIGDEAARVFAAAFYRALAFHRSVQEAFDQARTALLLEGIPEQNTPELLVKPGVDAAATILVGQGYRA